MLKMCAEKTSVVKYFIVCLAVLAMIISLTGVLSPGWYIYEGQIINYFKQDLGRLKRVQRDTKESSPNGAGPVSDRVGSDDGGFESPGGDPANQDGHSGLSEPPQSFNSDKNPRRPLRTTGGDNAKPEPELPPSPQNKLPARPNNRVPNPTHASNINKRTRYPSKNVTTSPATLVSRRGPNEPKRPRPTLFPPTRIPPSWKGRTSKPGKKPTNQLQTGIPGKPMPDKPNGSEGVLSFPKPTVMPKPSHTKPHKLPDRIPPSKSSTRAPKQRPVLSDKMPRLPTFFDWFTADKNELDWASLGSAEFSIHIGLWWGKVCTKINEHWNCDSEKLSLLFDKLDTLEVNVSSWNDMRIESVFALLFCFLGLTGTVFTVQPFCLKTQRRISLVLAVTGLVISCVLLLVAITRIANIHAHVNETLDGNPNATHLKTPWSPVLCCIGAGLAFAVALTLVFVTWRESREKWYKFDSDVDLTKTDGAQEVYTDVSNEFSPGRTCKDLPANVETSKF